MSERKEHDNNAELTTEDLMKSAPPLSVLGAVEDAVAPEMEGELTPWSSPRDEADEGAA